MDKILYQNKFRIPTIRLQSWDYSQDGWYFVTICTKKRKCTLGKVNNQKVCLSQIGKLVEKELLRTEQMRKTVKILEYVIMPNHIHAIILIDRAESIYAAQRNVFGSQSSNLAAIVRGIKGSSVTQAKKMCPRLSFQWQERFYEHIIRNEKALYKISQYILNNPAKWDIDENNPRYLGF